MTVKDRQTWSFAYSQIIVKPIKIKYYENTN